MIYAIFRNIFWIIFKLFFGFKVYGRENIPSEGGMIIASNHVSYLDPIMLGIAFLRPVHFMARESLFSNSIFGKMLPFLNTFAVRREYADFRALREATRRLHHGNAVVVFPEGTRSLDGKIQKGQPGLAIITSVAKAKVIPAYIKGSMDVLPRGAKFLKRGKVSIHFGKEIEFNQDFMRENGKPNYHLFTQAVMTKISELKDAAEK